MNNKQKTHPFVGETIQLFGQVAGTITDYDQKRDIFFINEKIRVSSEYLRETGELQKLEEKHGIAAIRQAKRIEL